MIVEAVITWEDGVTETIRARSFVELFSAIGERKIKRLDAYEVGVKDIRQGRRARYV